MTWSKYLTYYKRYYQAVRFNVRIFHSVKLLEISLMYVHGNKSKVCYFQDITDYVPATTLEVVGK